VSKRFFLNFPKCPEPKGKIELAITALWTLNKKIRWETCKAVFGASSGSH
jgi:hypothetical protein